MNRSSSKKFTLVLAEQVAQYLAPAMDVGFYLAERYVQRFRNLLITQVLEMKEHERHALMFGQFAQRALELLLSFHSFEVVGNGRFDRGDRPGIEAVALICGRLELAENPPAPPIAREMV